MVSLIARSTLSPQYVDESVFPLQTPTLQITELPLSGILRVQGRLSDQAFCSAVAEALGVQLPAAQRTTENADVTLVWAGPNEYLCFCALANEERYENALKTALKAKFAAVTLVSDSRFGLLITGSNAAAFVSQSCSIDIDPASFGIRQAATTRFASLSAMLIHHSENEYLLYFDIGYVEYVLKWLVEESEEFREDTA
ncbi:sarcosine oxidase subunit gamma [Caballeronia sp. DA-9]|uniref:sarcosine oxidase subunit gamma n=1 Tax=Caballeronia sp. DA-9 TaxID=3436237 RepID=UPI003F669FEF